MGGGGRQVSGKPFGPPKQVTQRRWLCAIGELSWHVPFAGMSEAGGKKSKLDDVSDDDDRAVPEELFNVVVAGDESPQSAGKK